MTKPLPEPASDAKIAALTALLEAVNATPNTRLPWQVQIEGGKPTLQYGPNGEGAIAHGALGSDDEFRLIVDAVNALPHLLSRIHACTATIARHHAELTAEYNRHRKELHDANNIYVDKYRRATNTAFRKGIYIASKHSHAARWRALRDEGMPIVASWIDEAAKDPGKSVQELWANNLLEASTAEACIVYRETGEQMKGRLVELGAAASHGVPVYAVGIEEFQFSNAPGITNCVTFEIALQKAMEHVKAQ